MYPKWIEIIHLSSIYKAYSPSPRPSPGSQTFPCRACETRSSQAITSRFKSQIMGEWWVYTTKNMVQWFLQQGAVMGIFFPTFRRFLWISRIVGTSKITIGFLRQDRNLVFKAGPMLRFQLSVFEHAEHMYTIMSYHCLYHIIHLWAHVLRTANTEDWSGGQKNLEEDYDGTVARVGRILNLSYSTGWYWLMFDVYLHCPPASWVLIDKWKYMQSLDKCLIN